MAIESVVMLVIGGAISLMFGVILAILKSGQKKADERWNRRVKSEWLQSQYNESVGNLALKTAKALHEKGTVNGDIDQEYGECKQKRKAYYDHVGAVHAETIIK